MPDKHLLHKTRVEEFALWCKDTKKLCVRPGRGPYQILQIQPKGSKDWYVLYERLHMPEHVTVPTALVPLVRNFIRNTR